jgi:hypothetical protein
MNGSLTCQANEPELVDIVDFKWLMAHEGHHVHVERLQRDRAYARECFDCAALSPTEALRQVAMRLMGAMGLAAA